MNIQRYSYNGSDITFQSGSNVMINATEMAKPFGKLTKDWLANKQTEELINSLSVKRGIPLFEIVRIEKGAPSTGGGTWLHEDAALLFAQWLSPDFYLWCNDRIKELLTKGSVSIDFSNPDVVLQLAQNWKMEQERRLQAEAALSEASVQIMLDAPKVAFTNAVSASASSCLVGELAKIMRQNGIPTGEKKLFEWLRQNNYLGSRGEYYNVPNQRYVEQGLFEIKKGIRSGSNGVLKTTLTTKVTGKGQVYLYNKLRQIYETN